jgi:hypothetical protein
MARRGLQPSTFNYAFDTFDEFPGKLFAPLCRVRNSRMINWLLKGLALHNDYMTRNILERRGMKKHEQIETLLRISLPVIDSIV